MRSCALCPRNCKVDRKTEKGFCGASTLPTVSKAMLHQWEEPCICYGNGSGAVFFSGCQLKCVFCQNHEISSTLKGTEMKSDELSDLFLRLEKTGACNINLVSPTPYLETIIPAIIKAKSSGLNLPIVFNSGGYESAQTIKKLDGLVDIYLPDFKFFSPELSARFAKAPDYADRASEVLNEMYKQTDRFQFKGDHLMKGIIVRHLVLPNFSADSVRILTRLANTFPKKDIILSIMRQYTPMFQADEFPELNRTITSLEYDRVVRTAKTLGFENIYTQSKESVGTKFVPDFSMFFDETN